MNLSERASVAPKAQQDPQEAWSLISWTHAPHASLASKLSGTAVLGKKVSGTGSAAKWESSSWVPSIPLIYSKERFLKGFLLTSIGVHVLALALI